MVDTYHHWKFDEGTGTISEDWGDAGDIDLAGLNTSNWSTSGYLGSSCYLPASDLIGLGVPWSTLSTSGTGSVSFWVRKAAAGNISGRILANTISGDGSWFIGNEGTNLIGGRFYNGGWKTTACTTVLTNNVWYHIVCVITTGSAMQFYLNSVAEGTPSSGGSTNATNANLFDEGGGGVPCTNMSIDDFRIFNYALTQQQINTLYNDGLVVDVTVTPSALTLSTTAQTPTIIVLIIPSTLSLTASLKTSSLYVFTPALAGTIAVGTGASKTRFISKRYPPTSGLTAGTTKQKGRTMNLVPLEGSLVVSSERKGIRA